MNKFNKKTEEKMKIEKLEEEQKNYKKKLVKKIFKEKTKSKQPVMKNYINYLLYTIENPKKK